MKKTLCLVVVGVICLSCGRNENDYFRKPLPPPKRMPNALLPINPITPVPYQVSTELKYVQPQVNRKVDFIFSIDNSGSMDPFIAAVQRNLVAFISGIVKENLDFQIGVIQNSWGHFSYPVDNLNFRGPYGVVAHTDPQLIYKVEKNIEEVRNTLNGHEEKPLFSIEYANQASANGRLFRADSAKVFFVLSDTQEPTNRSALDYYRAIQNNLGAQTRWRVVTVGNPSSNPCSQAEGDQPELEELTRLTGGLMARICDQDYVAILQKAVISTVSLVRGVDLSPRVPPGGVVVPSSIQIFIDGNPCPASNINGYLFDPVANYITFFGSFIPQPGQNVEIYFDYELP